MRGGPKRRAARRGTDYKSWCGTATNFILWYKRLESGVFKLPRVQEGARSVELRASELAMVLDGIDVSKLQRVPRYTRISNANKENILV